MNKKNLILARNQNWHQFHIPGGAHYKTVKKNMLFPCSSNKKAPAEVHELHEHCKLAVCLELKRLGKEFITEAVENNNDQRRDVVCLDSRNIYEIETGHLRAERPQLKGSIIALVEKMSLPEAIEYCKKLVRDNE